LEDIVEYLKEDVWVDRILDIKKHTKENLMKRIDDMVEGER
jgi:uncharacterized protein YeeX (DUF496 family)